VAAPACRADADASGAGSDRPAEPDGAAERIALGAGAVAPTDPKFVDPASGDYQLQAGDKAVQEGLDGQAGVPAMVP